MSERVLVVGATGRVGGELVRLLTAGPQTVRAAARTPEAARSKLPSSVEVVEFDFDRQETFRPALAGVDKVFLMARPGDNDSDRAAAPFIDLMKEEGVRHVVNLTAMGVEQDEEFMLRKLEKHLEASGISFTHLRPNWFMQNFDSGPMFAEIRATGSLRLPAGDAKLSFIDARDIAAVAAAALADPPRHEGKAYTLTGPEALDHFEVLDQISKAAGRTITYVPISEEAARDALASAAIPQGYIRRWAEFFRKVRAGLCAPATLSVEEVLGRPATGFQQYVRDKAHVWR